MVVTASDQAISDADIATGIVWAADNGARVINLSLGGPGESDVLTKRGGLRPLEGRGRVVAPAGNDGESEPEYPAAIPGRRRGLGTDWTGRLAEFSSYGPWVDLAAPAVQVASTTRDGGYRIEDGTSFAAPLVAATAALVRTQNPGWTQAQVVARIEATARDAGEPGVDLQFGPACSTSPQPSAPHLLRRSRRRTATRSSRTTLRRTRRRSRPIRCTRRRSRPRGTSTGTTATSSTPAQLTVQVSATPFDSTFSEYDQRRMLPEVGVYGPGLNLLASTSGLSGNTAEVAVPATTAGRYYVRVANAAGTQSNGPYRLSWSTSATPSTWDAFEPDTRRRAQRKRRSATPSRSAT